MQRDGNVPPPAGAPAATTRCRFSPGLSRATGSTTPTNDTARMPWQGLASPARPAMRSRISIRTRGNADFTIEEPLHYPFAFSDKPVLKWVNRQLVKSKPAVHKKTFLKDLHRSPEFCSSCHKVHLPEQLNHYKWVRGQNHYDTYFLSGVSGYFAQSFITRRRPHAGAAPATCR